MGFVAQLAEHRAFNSQARGSSPLELKHLSSPEKQSFSTYQQDNCWKVELSLHNESIFRFGSYGGVDERLLDDAI